MHRPISPILSMLALVVSAMIAGPASADPEIGVGTAVQLTTKVDAVDPVNGLVTVTGPFGNTVVLRAGPGVQINELRAGDRINVSYYEQTAFSLAKYQGPPITQGRDSAITMGAEAEMNMNPPTEAVQEWVQVAPPGAQPGAATVERVEVTATVKAIDYGNRVVTLYGPANTIRRIFVDPSVPGLDDIHEGDRIVMLVTEALAINVSGP